MYRCQIFSLSAVIATGSVLLAGSAIGQQNSLKNQVLGTWTYMSVYDQYEDGKRVENFGAHPTGTIKFGRDGRFVQLIIGEPVPALKSADPRRPDAPVVAYYGTYTVNEGDKSVTWKVEGGAYSPRIGAEVKNMIAVKGDSLTYVGSARKDQNGTFSPHAELRRAK
jgi:hypothetical protein